MAERLNGIKTSTNISFKTRNSYRNSASITFSCFESLSDSELLLSLFMNKIAIFVYCSAHVLAYLIHRVDYGVRRNVLSHLIHTIFWKYSEHTELYESNTTQVNTLSSRLDCSCTLKYFSTNLIEKNNNKNNH